ncbi:MULTISPECIES: hypothetical protein [unclassified Pedobacter]|uniref:hypothetical protein n=1 Tax=unclassified Pedobacter TaxID=2628915 RepID=UPI001DCE43D2|nr:MULTISPECIES: hypothetical protein [unclassified Pedobacter]CAH0235965.1 hypothetical protein SRABI36_02842 [Pedobacter sp. Bi36]CAH0262524.1 hypothetical protein SRABI126_03242 [Pedobacter sp. Bi126]
MKLQNIKIVSLQDDLKPNILKGNKSLNPKELFGIWKNNPKNLKDIRSGSWDFKN